MGTRRFVTTAAAVAAALSFGIAPVNAAPLDPPPPAPGPDAPPSAKAPLKAMKCWPYGRVGPGSARGGGGVPVYPPPCPPGTPH